ncbi:MAG: M28 family peptidase [Sphingobacteriales bacterium]|nr:MAG: M28 family peptidase [Sphingobacteriales bacterium]
MKRKIALLLFISPFFGFQGQTQILKNLLGTSSSGPIPANEVLIQNFRTDLQELVQARYNNRLMGTTGYKNLSGHLEKRMQQLGLIRYGTVGYRSSFKFPVGRQLSVESKFYIEGKALHLNKDVLPMPFAPADENTAYLIPKVNEAHAPWTLPLPNDNITESNIARILKPTILNAQERGANAIYFYDDRNGSTLDLQDFAFKGADLDPDIRIPVWLISKKAWTDNFKNIYSVIPVNTVQRYKTTYEEGYNIIGLIDNKAEKTVLVMADYDQVLFDPENNPGANATASGVAALLQLSHILKAPEFKNYNYAFAAFSGSAKGQLGAKSFLNIPEMKSKIAYVVDLNAIGKLNANNDIFINGIASATRFRTAIKEVSEGYKPRVGMKYPYNASYNAFIESEIPTLSFSTGYPARPGGEDNITSINFNGMAQTLRFVVAVMSKVNQSGNIYFAKNNIEVNDEDLVIQKVPAPAVAKTLKTTTPKGPSSAQRLAQAKNNLKSNQPAGAKPRSNTPGAAAKLPVETPYYGASNIIIDFLGIGINELDKREGGAVIQSVASNSKGAQLGFQRGDVLLQIGSFPIFNAKSYLMTLERFKTGERAYYKVKKADGKTVMVDVNF